MNHKCTPPGGNTTAGAELSAERRAYLRQVRRQKQEITLWRAGVLVGLLLLRALKKEDIMMLPKGEKMAKILEKYSLLGSYI